VTKLVE
jgi:hypothetical protein